LPVRAHTPAAVSANLITCSSPCSTARAKVSSTAWAQSAGRQPGRIGGCGRRVDSGQRRSHRLEKIFGRPQRRCLLTGEAGPARRSPRDRSFDATPYEPQRRDGESVKRQRPSLLAVVLHCRGLRTADHDRATGCLTDALGGPGCHRAGHSSLYSPPATTATPWHALRLDRHAGHTTVGQKRRSRRRAQRR
jgi:hypothetical protein